MLYKSKTVWGVRRQIDKIINEVTPWLLQLSLAAPFCSWGTLGKNGVFAATGMFRAHSNIMLFYYRVLKIWHQQLWAAENPRADLLLGKPDQIPRCQPCRQLKVYFWLFVLPWRLFLASLVLKEGSSFGVTKTKPEGHSRWCIKYSASFHESLGWSACPLRA